MKRALPANAKIAKDAKETVQECVSEFISFITSECVKQARSSAPNRRVLGAPGARRPAPAAFSVSDEALPPGCSRRRAARTRACRHVDSVPVALRRASDKCQREKRKTINGDDLLWAMSTLGFEEYVEPLRVYLQKYREVRLARLCVRCPALTCGTDSLRSLPRRPRCVLSCESRRARSHASVTLTATAAQGEKASAAKAGEAKKDMHFSLGFQQ